MIGFRTLFPIAASVVLLPTFSYAETPVSFSCPTDNSVFTSIPSIQGTGKISPYATIPTSYGYISPDYVYVKATVSQIGQSLNKGFYLLDTKGDGNPNTSDGIFVYLKDVQSKYPSLKPGATVCLQAKVEDYYGSTQLDLDYPTPKLTVVSQGEVPKPYHFRVEPNETLDHALRRYEGMPIILDRESDLKVTCNFSYDYDRYRNNLVLSYQAPLMMPTQLYPAGSEQAEALQKANASNRLVVESDYKAKAGVLPWLPDWDASEGYIRIGDMPINLQGMVAYNFDKYRLIVPEADTISIGDLVRTSENDRQAAPQRAKGTDVRIGSFNVLNFFTSNPSIGGALNITCDGVYSDSCNRGAKSASDFAMQRAKIVSAITQLNADVLALMELENNGYGDTSSIANLVNALNKDEPYDKRYQYIVLPKRKLTDGKYFGTDAISVGIIYRPHVLRPVGSAKIITMPNQQYTDSEGQSKSAHQRNSLMQTFKLRGQRGKFTLVANHLKSKGSGCLEDTYSSEENVQGHCNDFRVSAAKVLGDRVSKMRGNVLLVGDFNSYAQEDPIRVLTNYQPHSGERPIMSASKTYIGDKLYEEKGSEVTHSYGFVDLNAKQNGAAAISYSYNGEQGTLDYALANKRMEKHVLQVADWHINSYESEFFEYGSKYTGDLQKYPNPFSASDHDPVIIDVKFAKKHHHKH
ncbi:ExeM/NucH family extracellular endonuclease [Vibrio sp. S4M6]|uniref:ExeM/NucH family extracellular endonuclease n=1 Tax=Vibrio sinus TaxID=2946865 RepID=UPI002029E51D|nr:ExeM/NucH family extracellular endonuclease [Vibrio sinus]MCL9781184.1 ExeM/NucH family extracellular endonuclease [Vibrio sinus]